MSLAWAFFQITSLALEPFDKVYIEEDSAAHGSILARGRKVSLRNLVYKGSPNLEAGQPLDQDGSGIFLNKITMPVHLIWRFRDDVAKMFTFKNEWVKDDLN